MSRALSADDFSPQARQRFEDNYVPEPNSGCWLWLAGVTKKKGYATMKIGTRRIIASRAAWALFRGPLQDSETGPGEICVLHKCDVPSCVNPAHLFLGTHQDNAFDREHKGRGFRFGHGEHPAAKRPPKGTSNPRALITDADVRTIRAEALAGAKHKDLAARYGLRPSYVGSIIYGRTWSHVLPSGE